MQVHGDFPNILYRSFNHLEHASQFLNGFVRFGSVLKYRDKELNGRHDRTEGEGHYTLKGVNQKVPFVSNVPYALCCHRDLDSAFAAGHGKFIVEISNPKNLAESITNSLKLQNSKYFGGVEGVFIEYTKGKEKIDRLEPYENSRLTYSQKPESYQHENEFRFVFIKEKIGGEFLSFQLQSGVGGGVIHEFT